MGARDHVALEVASPGVVKDKHRRVDVGGTDRPLKFW